MKAVPDQVARWVPGHFVSLGTDGYGRSESRAALRDFFEVDHRFVVVSTLDALARDGRIEADVVKKAIKDLNINPEKSNPATS
jgi:pyruvate dehydrogenase E1 component